MTAPDAPSKVAFTQSRLHMAAQLEKTTWKNYSKKHFRKTANVGCVYSVSSHLLKRKTEVYYLQIYLQITTALCCNTGQKLRWKEINPHKKPSLVPFPPSSLCHIFYIVIVYNSKSPKPELVLLPSPSSPSLHLKVTTYPDSMSL